MTRRVFQYAGRDWPDPRNTWAWRKLRDQVVDEEPVCWLRYPDRCTTVSTTADHVIPIVERPDLGMDRTNLRGACRPCNDHRRHHPAPAPHVRPGALRFFDAAHKIQGADTAESKPAASLPPARECPAKGGR